MNKKIKWSSELKWDLTRSILYTINVVLYMVCVVLYVCNATSVSKVVCAILYGICVLCWGALMIPSWCVFSTKYKEFKKSNQETELYDE